MKPIIGVVPLVDEAKNSLWMLPGYMEGVEKARPLKIMAVADDGIIEAVEMTDKKFVWGIQWHPEFSYKSDENSRLNFEEFVRRCIE